MNILVTGAAGFVGHKTSEFLLEEGHKVIGVDNLNDYYDVEIKNYRLSLLNNKENFVFSELDIENFSSLENLFKEHKIDKVINLAARAGVRFSMENPHIYMSTNAQGTLNILECMKIFKVNKLVLASTSSLYAGLEMPFLESLAVNTPISPYAATKKAAETMAYTYHHLYGIDVSIVRYFTVYGPASRPDMAQFRFMRWIEEGTPIELFGDGAQSRDFTYIDDIARGTILALKDVGYEIINLGGGNNPISINTMISTLEDLLNKKAEIKKFPFHKADMKTTWANIDKASSLLGWKPEIDFVEGLRRSVQNFNDNKDFFKKVLL